MAHVNLSEKSLEDFGDSDFIVAKIENELNVQFNSQKQKILKFMKSYVSNKNLFSDKNSLILYGVKKYEHIWEELCSNAFDSKLKTELDKLILPKPLNDKYKSEIIYDEFTTPDKINNWVKDKTNGMIEKILDEMNSDFVMGLASALAIDVKWLDEFECTSTNSEEFTKINNEKINVQMMHNTYKNMNYKYFKNDDSEGIIIPYQKEEDSNVELEFIGILPTGSVDSFVKGLTKDKLINIDKNVRVAGEDLHINVSLPRFKYDYEPNDFISILKGLGIKEAFDPDNANFKNMIEIKENVYVGEAIHKTHIELNEKGTKAAAITYFGMFKNSAMLPSDPEIINIKFNKPFVYMIREKNTKEILFFGTVYEPNTWNGSTCENEKGK